jgi:hypothetical protein
LQHRRRSLKILLRGLPLAIRLPRDPPRLLIIPPRLFKNLLGLMHRLLESSRQFFRSLKVAFRNLGFCFGFYDGRFEFVDFHERSREQLPRDKSTIAFPPTNRSRPIHPNPQNVTQSSQTRQPHRSISKFLSSINPICYGFVMATPNAIANSIDRLLDPVSRCIRGDAEKELLNLHADAELQERIDLLADRCNEGLLTAEERGEYETYIRFGNFIAILQAKARLRRSTAPA